MLATDDFRNAAFQFVQNLAEDLSSADLELPGFPEVVMELNRTLGDANCSVRDLVRLTNTEPVLAARLIQLSNSAEFSPNDDEISDLNTAIKLLGSNVLRTTATNFAMRQMQQQEWLKPVRSDLERMWRRSNSVAAICYSVAKHVDGIKPDEALVVGLFHQVGNLYLLTRAHREGLAIADNPDWEDVANGWHPTIARAIVESWGLAQYFGEATERQDALLDRDSTHLSLHAILLSAAKIYDRMCNESSANNVELEKLLQDVTLCDEPFLDLVSGCKEDIAAMLQAIS